MATVQNTTKNAEAARIYANEHRAQRKIFQLSQDIDVPYHLLRDFARQHTKRPAYALVVALLQHKQSNSGAE